jgi:8-oxo-dGTP diphosphatase
VSQVHYEAFGRPKVVDYFSARALWGSFVPNDESDELRWLPVDEAAALLTTGPATTTCAR